MTNRLLFSALALAATLVAGSVMAKDLCSVPKADWQQSDALKQKLTQEGWTVKKLKTEDGCYEVYGTNPQGQRVEAFFNPKTFDSVKVKIEG